jgi:hypothetical protein
MGQERKGSLVRIQYRPLAGEPKHPFITIDGQLDFCKRDNWKDIKLPLTSDRAKENQGMSFEVMNVCQSSVKLLLGKLK